MTPYFMRTEAGWKENLVAAATAIGAGAAIFYAARILIAREALPGSDSGDSGDSGDGGPGRPAGERRAPPRSTARSDASGRPGTGRSGASGRSDTGERAG